MLLTLVKNPEKISKDFLKDAHYCFRQPLQNSHIVIEDAMLIYCKPIWGSASYCCLRLYPLIYKTSYLPHSTPTQSAGTSTLTRLCTAFAFATIGQRCSPTFDTCAVLSLAALLPPDKTSCRNWSTTSPSMPPSGFYSLTGIQPDVSPASRETKHTSSCIAA